MATESVEHSVASSVTPVTFALTGYYSNVLVENLTTTSGVVIWARADGTAAVSEADGCFAIDPGQSLVLSNGLAIYDQGLLNVAKGTMLGGGLSLGTPYQISPLGSSLAGGTANPGSTVSVILDTGSGPVQVAVSSVD